LTGETVQLLKQRCLKKVHRYSKRIYFGKITVVDLSSLSGHDSHVWNIMRVELQQFDYFMLNLYQSIPKETVTATTGK